MEQLIFRLFGLLQVSLAAAIFRLDRVAFFQSLLHRPVFLAPFLGWLIGDLQLGVRVAIVTEFISLFLPPTGTDIPPDEGGWAATAIGSLCLIDPRLRETMLPLSLLLSLMLIPIFRNLEIAIRSGNERLARFANDQAKRGKLIPFKRLVFASVTTQLVLFVAMYMTAGSLFGMALHLVSLSTEILQALTFFSTVVIALLPLYWVHRTMLNRERKSRWLPLGALASGVAAGFLIWVVA